MNTDGQTIEIPSSKEKLFLLLLISIGFVIAGCWFVFDPPSGSNSDIFEERLFNIVGIAAIVFFGLCAGYVIAKLPDKKPGLVITDDGLIDNSSGVAAGEIEWADIHHIAVLEIYRQKIIMLHVRDPQKYIDR